MKSFGRHIAKACPSCGAVMEPEEIIRNCDHSSQWWRCTNETCLTKWLLPITSERVQFSRAS